MLVAFRGLNEEQRKKLKHICIELDMSMSEAFRLFVQKVFQTNGQILLDWKSEETQELNFEWIVFYRNERQFPFSMSMLYDSNIGSDFFWTIEYIIIEGDILKSVIVKNVPERMHKDFKRVCLEHDTTISTVVRNHMQAIIKRYNRDRNLESIRNWAQKKSRTGSNGWGFHQNL